MQNLHLFIRVNCFHCFFGMQCATKPLAYRLLRDKCKNHFQFKTVCNGNTAYLTQIKQQKSRTAKIKKVLLLWQHIAIMSTFSSAIALFRFLSVLVVCAGRVAVTDCFKLGVFFYIYICCLLHFLIFSLDV